MPAVRPARRIRSLNWTTAEWNDEVDGPQVELYALGVGPDVDVDELSLIASPLPRHVLLVTNVDTFEVFSRGLHAGLITPSSSSCIYTQCVVCLRLEGSVLVVWALDLRLDGREFDSRPSQLILHEMGGRFLAGKSPQYFTEPPGQLSFLLSAGREVSIIYRPKCGDAVWHGE